MNVSTVVVAIALLIFLSACNGYRFVSIPFDAAGRSLNSPYADVSPKITSRYIAFASDRSGSQDIYLYDMAERRLVALPEVNAIDTIASDPDVSEDGRYLVFSATRQGKSDIYVYDRQLQQMRNLTGSLAADVRHPSISADGSTIAFESNLAGQWDVLLYDRLGRAIDLATNANN